MAHAGNKITSITDTEITKGDNADRPDSSALSELLAAHTIDVEQLNVAAVASSSSEKPVGRIYQLLQSPASLPGKVPVPKTEHEESFINDQFLEEAARRIAKQVK